MKLNLFIKLKKIAEKIQLSFYKKFDLWAVMVITGLSFLIFLPFSFDNYFHTGPDWRIVSIGEKIFPSGHFSAPALHASIAAISSNAARILDWFTWILDYRIWGLNAQPYFIENTCLHILNAILLFFLLNLLFKEKVLSFISALFFCVHPVNAIVAVDVSGRPAGLCTFFFLSSLFLFGLYLIHKKRRFYIFSLISALFALLSKEVVIFLPFIIILIGVYIKRGLGSLEPGINKNLVAAGKLHLNKLGGILIYLPYFILTMLVFISINKEFTAGFGPGPHSYWYKNIYANAENYWLHINFSRIIAKEYFFLIPHMLYVLSVFVFKKFLLVPWDICRYMGLKTGGELFYTIIFIILMAFFALKVFLKKNLSGKILLFGIIWIFINTFPILGTCTDLKDIFEGMRHLYLISIGYCIVLSWLLVGNKKNANKFRKINVISSIILCLLLVNFIYRSVEFTSSVKLTTIDVKKFVLGFKKLLPGLPEKSNYYFLTNQYNLATCGFLLSGYPKQIKDSNYYYAMSGTDIFFCKPKQGEEGRILAINTGFDLTRLNLNKTDFVIGWDDQYDKLIDLTGTINSLIARQKIRANVEGNVKSDLANVENVKNWNAAGDLKINKSLGNGLALVSFNNIKDAMSDFRQYPKIFSPKVDIPANLIKKIIIEIKILPHMPLEDRFIPGRIKASMEARSLFVLDVFKSIFIAPFNDEIIWLSWTTKQDNNFGKQKALPLIVQTDNEFHTYELFPQNSLEWLKSKEVVQLGISLQLLFNSEVEIKSIKFILSDLY
ncbi:MAG: hypothetical protein WCY09_01625 [Candidatus Omnitrophota bacterium]